jgi:hypothetical protein
MRRLSGHVSWLLPMRFEGLTPKPGDALDDRHGNGDREGRARHADGPKAARINGPDPLAEATLGTRPQGILACGLWRLLALSCHLERLVMGLQMDRQLAGGTRAAGDLVKPAAKV